MYSQLFADHGIRVTEQEVEVRRDGQGPGASQLRQRLEAAGEVQNGAEISRLIDEANALGIGDPQI